MATQKFKAAINNASFPFLHARASSGVLQPGLDVAPRVGGNFSGGESIDFNTISMIFCENVIPTKEGIQSVSFFPGIPAVEPAVTHFDQLMILRDSVERNFLFAPARGQNYVYKPSLGIWETHNTFVWASDKTEVSRAYVVGRTFVCYERDRIIEWDPVLEVFNTVSITLPAGYTMADIRGCCGASNYLILFTDIEILWSSLVDVTNFADTVNGSGRQTPIDLKGQVTCVVAISGGFVIYTNRNAVAAFATDSADKPFTFREVLGSGGVASYEQITGDANQAEHYTYGSSGVQRVSLQQAVTVFPGCADFLASRQYEEWDTATKTIKYKQLMKSLAVKMQYLANRYLVISYGIRAQEFEFALIYDSALERWGKVRTPHVDVGVLPLDTLEAAFRYFEMPLPYEDESYADYAYEDLVKDYGNVPTLRTGFAFLRSDGQVDLLISELPNSGNGLGIAVFGHVQVSRGRNVMFQSAELDGLELSLAPTALVLPANPGNGYKRLPGIAVFTAEATERHASYLSGENVTVCENFDFALEGVFSLTTMILETSIHGSR